MEWGIQKVCTRAFASVATSAASLVNHTCVPRTTVVGNTKPNEYESMAVLKRWYDSVQGWCCAYGRVQPLMATTLHTHNHRGDADKSRAVTCMNLLPSMHPKQQQAGGTLSMVGRADGSAQLLDMTTGESLQAFPTAPPCPSSNGAADGADDVSVVDAYTAPHSTSLSCVLTYTHGMVRVSGVDGEEGGGDKGHSVEATWRVAQRVACSVCECRVLGVGACCVCIRVYTL